MVIHILFEDAADNCVALLLTLLSCTVQDAAPGLARRATQALQGGTDNLASAAMAYCQVYARKSQEPAVAQSTAPKVC